MGLQGNPFALTDFSINPSGPPGTPTPTSGLGGLPVDPAAEYGRMQAGQQQGPSPTAPSGPPGMPPADISADMDPVEGFSRSYRYLASLIASPKYIGQEGSVVNPLKEDPTWANQVAMAQKEVDYFASTFAKQGDTERAKAAQRLADEAAKERSQISANASITSAGISAGASAFSAQEATRRQELADNAALGRLELTGQQGMAERNLVESGMNNRLGISEAGANARLDKSQVFDAEQNRLNREIQNMANQLAAGRINMETALGTIDKWLQAQQYTLPQGAEYVPGFQPGGAVQETARLAGVGYNPSNYKANTVPFDPAAVVRQTMGR